jgi:carnitine O-acetyltransferase
MLDGSSTEPERVRLFLEAVKQHGQDMKLASSGQGIDRHFFGSSQRSRAKISISLLTFEVERRHIGLKRVMEAGEPVPELFSDPLFNRSATWTMSTSQVYIEKAPAYGWGNVMPDGFGVPYMLHSGNVQPRKRPPGFRHTFADLVTTRLGRSTSVCHFGLQGYP